MQPISSAVYRSSSTLCFAARSHTRVIPDTDIPEPLLKPEGIRPFLTALETRYDPLRQQAKRAQWVRDTIGHPADVTAFEEAEAKLANHWYHSPIHTWVERFARSAIPEHLKTTDPTAFYQWTFFYDRYKPIVAPSTDLPVETAPLSTLTRLQDQQEELELQHQVTRAFNLYHQTCKRHAAPFRPSPDEPTLGDSLLALLRKRNAIAGRYGASNYYDYYSSWIFERNADEWRFMRSVLSPVMITQYKQLLKQSNERTYVKQLSRWNRQLLTQLNRLGPEAIIRDTARLMGIPSKSMEQLIHSSRLYCTDVAEQGQVFACYAVNAPDDIRVLVNMSRKKSQRTLHDYVTLIHEIVGHSFDYMHLQPNLPPSARDHHSGVSTESIAIQSELLLTDTDWLERVAKVDKNTLEPLKPILAHSRALTLLRFMIQLLSDDITEEQLYRHADSTEPERELAMNTVLYAHGFKKRAVKPGYWANDHLFDVMNPTYMPNYILATLNAIEMAERANKDFKGISSEGWLDHLRQARQHGLVRPWADQWQHITGRPILGVDDIPGVLSKLYTVA